MHIGNKNILGGLNYLCELVQTGNCAVEDSDYDDVGGNTTVMMLSFIGCPASFLT